MSEGSASSGNEAASRQRPSRPLPTDRVVVAKQLDVLRAFAITSGSNQQSVKNAEVGEVVSLAESTVAMTTPFFVDVGLLTKTKEGFIPCDEVFAFARSHEFGQEDAVCKLRPILKESWCAECLLPKLRFRSMTRDEAIADLADNVAASSHYRGQLDTLILFLDVVGVIDAENGSVKAVITTEENPQETPGPSRDYAEKPQGGTEHAEVMPSTAAATRRSPDAGGVSFSVDIQVDMSELQDWSPDRITAFFSGLAAVVSAKKGLDESN